MAKKITNVEKYLELTAGDIKKMTRRELAKVVSTLASAANKRLVRLEEGKMGTEAPAYQTAMKVGKFSVAGKSQGELQAEYKRVKTFYSRKSSSITGWKGIRKEVRERIGGEWTDIEDEKEYWRAYRDIEKKYYNKVQTYGSLQAQRDFRAEFDDNKRGAKRRMINKIKKYNEDVETKKAEEAAKRKETFYTIDNQDLER